MISVSAYGNLFIWNVPYRENWSAFVPGFQELEENIEYIEHEDEFDNKYDLVKEMPSSVQMTDDTIDVETVEKIHLPFDSDSERDNDSTIVIPVEPDPDVNEAPMEIESGKRRAEIANMSNKPKRPKSSR